MKADYFADLGVPTVPTLSPLDRRSSKARQDGHVPTVPGVPSGSTTHLAEMARLPLAAKLRAYGEPFPLLVSGRVAAWLVPDADVTPKKDEPVYTAAEAVALGRAQTGGDQ